MKRSCTRVPLRWRRPRMLASALLSALLLLSACNTARPTTPPRPGTLRWRVQITDTQRATPVFVANGELCLAGRDHAIYALDAATGARRWQAQTDNTAYAAPAVANGVLYDISGAGNGSVAASDATTGALRWRTHTGSFCCSGLAAPAVADGVVYVGAADTYIYALDAATGALRWQYQTGGGMYLAPVVADGVAYVGSGDGFLYALNA